MIQTLSDLRSPQLVRWFAVLAVVAVAGCGKSGDATVPVSGRVLVNGKPAKGAAVVFHPVEQNTNAECTRSIAQVDENGEFRLTTTKAGDGASPGEYRVTLTWYAPTQSRQRVSEGEDSPARNLLPDKYAHADSTPLTATVRSEGTEPIKFEITVPANRR